MPRKVKIIGLGGIGSYLAEPLCRYLNYLSKLPNAESYEVTLIDGDKYESKNQDRQIFDRFENKAEVTAEMLRKKFIKIHFRHKGEYIIPDNVVSLVREKDLIFLCVDNHKTRKLVSDRCKELDDVTLISGGNEKTDGNVIYYRRQDGEDVTRSPCDLHGQIMNPTDKNPGEGGERQGCEEIALEDPQLLITNFAAASHMLNVFYASTQDRAKFEQVFFDILSQRSRPTPELF